MWKSITRTILQIGKAFLGTVILGTVLAIAIGWLVIHSEQASDSSAIPDDGKIVEPIPQVLIEEGQLTAIVGDIEEMQVSSVESTLIIEGRCQQTRAFLLIITAAHEDKEEPSIPPTGSLIASKPNTYDF